jgi:hypothetical protein
MDFKSVWDKLNILNNTMLVLSSTRLVIPELLHRPILDQLHTSHSAITRVCV